MAGSSISSGALPAGTAVVVARKSYLNHVMLVGGGVAAATVVLYDNASAGSGTVLATLRTDTAGVTSSVDFARPVRADNGIVAVVTGADAQAVVSFDVS